MPPDGSCKKDIWCHGVAFGTSRKEKHRLQRKKQFVDKFKCATVGGHFSANEGLIRGNTRCTVLLIGSVAAKPQKYETKQAKQAKDKGQKTHHPTPTN